MLNMQCRLIVNDTVFHSIAILLSLTCADSILHRAVETLATVLFKVLGRKYSFGTVLFAMK